jgi:hypothetical protein
VCEHVEIRSFQRLTAMKRSAAYRWVGQPYREHVYASVQSYHSAGVLAPTVDAMTTPRKAATVTDPIHR